MLLIADLDVHGLDCATGAAEDGVTFAVGADDRRGFAEAVALEDRDADGIEPLLQFYVQQGAAAHKETHLAAKSVLANLCEELFVEEVDERLLPEMLVPGLAGVIVFLIVAYCQIDREVEEFLHPGALGLDARLDVLLEGAGKGGNAEHHVGLHVLDGSRHVAQGGQLGFAHGNGGDAAAVHHHGVESGHMRKAVVQREDDEHPGAFFDADDRSPLLHVRGVVAVSEQDALRVCRGAGGV